MNISLFVQKSQPLHDRKKQISKFLCRYPVIRFLPQIFFEGASRKILFYNIDRSVRLKKILYGADSRLVVISKGKFRFFLKGVPDMRKSLLLVRQHRNGSSIRLPHCHLRGKALLQGSIYRQNPVKDKICDGKASLSKRPDNLIPFQQNAAVRKISVTLCLFRHYIILFLSISRTSSFW